MSFLLDFTVFRFLRSSFLVFGYAHKKARNNLVNSYSGVFGVTQQ